jgi:general stress protein 26
MIAEPARSLLDEAKSLQVATIGRDGWPQQSTLWFGWVDGDMVAWTLKTSPKAQNMRRDRRVSGLVDLGTDYGEIRGVSLRGTVELVEDPTRLTEIARAIFTRNFPPDEQPDVDALVGAGRRVGLVFSFDRVFHWDSRGTGRRAPQP